MASSQPQATSVAPSDVRTVQLSGPLEGASIDVDADRLDFGVLDDLQSNSAPTILDCLARCIVGGTLPKGSDRDGMRRLKMHEITPVIEAVCSLLVLPKGA